MRGAIAFVLGNFTLTFFVLGLIASAIALWHARQPRSPAVIVEALFSYFLLFSIAIANFYNFVLHVFFGKTAAAFIGWADSPFQLEVGFASLGFAAVGLLAFKGSFDMRLAAILGPACFLWGAAGGHIYQMIATHNFAPGNAGIIFYSDILVPIIGFIFLWLQRRLGDPRHRRDPGPLIGKCRSGALHLRRRSARTKREHCPGSGPAAHVLWKSVTGRGPTATCPRTWD